MDIVFWLTSNNGRERKMTGGMKNRKSDFISHIARPNLCEPEPSKDFGMYKQMDAALTGLHEHLDELRRNQGRLGYTAQNLLSDLSKAYIKAVRDGAEEEMMFTERSMGEVLEGFGRATDDGALAEAGNRFSRTMWQELWEAELFGKIWPVIIGKTDAVSELKRWQDFDGNVQAYLYGYLDVVSELAKALTEQLSRPDMTSELEFTLFERYLVVAESITLRLSLERHVPGYVINNDFGRWNAYRKKLYTAYGCMANVRRDYNLRRSIERIILGALNHQR